ncbi:MAG: hypothetical protein V3V78_03665 [Candidatus Woesearchaeota archaeon]
MKKPTEKYLKPFEEMFIVFHFSQEQNQIYLVSNAVYKSWEEARVLPTSAKDLTDLVDLEELNTHNETIDHKTIPVLEDFKLNATFVLGQKAYPSEHQEDEDYRTVEDHHDEHFASRTAPVEAGVITEYAGQKTY